MALRNQRVFRDDRGRDLLQEFEREEQGNDPMAYVRQFFGGMVFGSMGIYVVAVLGALYFLWPALAAHFQTAPRTGGSAPGRQRELLVEEEREKTKDALAREVQLRRRLLMHERGKTKKALLKLLQDESVQLDGEFELDRADLTQLRQLITTDFEEDTTPVTNLEYDSGNVLRSTAWGAGTRPGTIPFEWTWSLQGPTRLVRISVWAGGYLDGIAVELANGQIFHVGKVTGAPTSTLDLSTDPRLRRIVVRSGEWLDGINFIATQGRETTWTGGTGGTRQEFVLPGLDHLIVGLAGSAVPENGPIDKIQVLYSRALA